MSAARDQLTRMLALVPYLQGKRDLSVEQVADQFGVTPSRIIADLNVLYMCGLPGLMPGDMIEVDLEAFESDGDRIVRLDNAEYLSRPLRLDSAEAAALVLALRALRASSDPESGSAIDRALVKLEAATAEGISGAHVLDVPDHLVASAPLRADLEAAIAAGRQVRLVHLNPARDERTERVVDPVAVLTAAGFEYLDAWCHRAEDRRTFRLDRIESAQVLDTPLERHDLSPLDLSEGLFTPGPDHLLARLRLAAQARWVAEYYPVESVADIGEGGLEITLRVSDPSWLLRLVMRLAPYADLVEPAELREQLDATVTATLQHYLGAGA